MSRPERFFAGLLVAALAGAAWAYHWAQARQAAALTRITALERCLAASNQQRAQDARNSLLGINTSVSRNRNQAADVAVLLESQRIQHRTETMVDTLRQVRQAWAAGRQLATQPALLGQLARYKAFARRYSAYDPWLVPQPTPGVEWLPVVETESSAIALATLTRLETQVRQLAAVALEGQAVKVGSGCCMCFDRIGAAAIPASETVAPGAIYQARLLLTVGGGAGRRVQFSADGHEIPYDAATGRAAVHFKIPAARPGQPDTVRAYWHGRVRLPGALADTVLETTVPYFIVKSFSF